jgi:hypothetical protein
MEKPKWFQPKTTPLCETLLSYFSAAGSYALSTAKTDILANNRVIEITFHMWSSLQVGSANRNKHLAC